MFKFFKKTPNKKSNKLDKDYAQMGRQFEALYDTVRPDRAQFYKVAFLRGILGGIGGIIGATVVLALLIWILTLLGEVPLIGGLIDSVKSTIETAQ